MARIRFKVTKNSRLVTPAPTAASVIAKSGDSRSTHIMDMMELYDMKIITDANKFFVKLQKIAQRIRNTSKSVSMIPIIDDFTLLSHVFIRADFQVTH